MRELRTGGAHAAADSRAPGPASPGSTQLAAETQCPRTWGPRASTDSGCWAGPPSTGLSRRRRPRGPHRVPPPWQCGRTWRCRGRP
eukprot:3997549-Pyramimonas_sp.AAC.1